MFEFLGKNEDGDVEAEEETKDVTSRKDFAKELLKEKTKSGLGRIMGAAEVIRGADSGLSKATQKYFEDWDGFEFKFPAVKNRIRQRIREREKENQQIYESFADKLGVAVDDLKEKLQERLEDVVKKSDFFVAVSPYVLECILEDGKFKTQFETHTSGGLLAPNERTRVEYEMFGTFKSLVKRRPVYGFISDNENGVVNSEGKIPPSNVTRKYGGVHIKLSKEKVISKATIASHDTLLSDGGLKFPPTPAAKPHFASFYLGSVTNISNIINFLNNNSRTSVAYQFYEAQYHGGLNLDEVESIHISKANYISNEEMEQINRVFDNYKKNHPDNNIKLVIY